MELVVRGQFTVVKGFDAVAADIIDTASSYMDPGFRYSKAYKKGLWDGKKRLFNRRTGALPTGLVHLVEEAFKQADVDYVVTDERRVPTPTEAGFDLVGTSFAYPYDYQLDACKKAVEAKQGILKMATGAGKTEVACSITQYLGLPTLFIVNSRELMYQAQKRFIKRLGLTDDEVGVAGDGCWSPGTLVTVAICDTLASRIHSEECAELLQGSDVMFIDECHGAAASTFSVVLEACTAYYRFGLSGTPLDRTDGANLRLIAMTGPVVVDIPTKLIVERGVVARANIIFDKITEPVLPKGIPYSSAYKQGVTDNPVLMQKVVAWTEAFFKQGLSVLILCEEIAHGKAIDDKLWTEPTEFIPHQFIHGSDTAEVRQGALDAFAARTLPVLIGSSILDEGIDVQSIDAMILAGSRKSKIRTLQRIGRGLRGEKLIAVEFANFTNKHLMKHSLQRLKDYKAEECFPVINSGPDATLVKKLWEGDGGEHT